MKTQDALSEFIENTRPRTYAFDELDAMAKAAACRFAQIERGDYYEKDWPEFFHGWRFHSDGRRAF